MCRLRAIRSDFVFRSYPPILKEPRGGETGSIDRQMSIGVLIAKIVKNNLGISMLLDIELSRQGMERERGWVGRISYENNEVDAVFKHCELTSGVAATSGKGSSVVENPSRFYVVI